jgi:hypothetical protein
MRGRVSKDLTQFKASFETYVSLAEFVEIYILSNFANIFTSHYFKFGAGIA